MLVMAAAVSAVDGNADFAGEYRELLAKWAGYLLRHGVDPENQLCTDDFAGHLAHNCNLSLKAIMGLAGYAGCAGCGETGKRRPGSTPPPGKWLPLGWIAPPRETAASAWPSISRVPSA